MWTYFVGFGFVIERSLECMGSALRDYCLHCQPMTRKAGHGLTVNMMDLLPKSYFVDMPRI